MRHFYAVLSLLFFYPGKAQVILNAYASVTNISGTTLSLANADETNHTFAVGEKVVVMQMQDDVIGANTTNASTFGDLSAIGNAGRYEIAYISGRTPAMGPPTSITLMTALAATYNTGVNSSVQVITLRNMGSNFTTTSAITGLAWNGSIGGVVAFEVGNTLTLNHSISANLLGFQGGLKSTSAGGGCDPTTYIINSSLRGYKGEGIYKSTNATFTNGRGHILNGGGGGNEHNAGGAGGGNYTSGGDGGPGYNCGTPAGGLGGISLSGQIAANRIFMGGGGGGGGQNNSYNADGVRGGGIVLIKASTLTTNAGCSGISITANGGTAANVGNDGAGGGGAGGSIVLDVSSFSVAGVCPLAVNANGGNGGDVGDGTVHAGGGGGGQGAVIYTIAQPVVNITTTTNNGLGGKNNSAGSSYAGSGGGTNNSGIIPSAVGNPLPIELVSYQALTENGGVRLVWITASEKNNDYFTVEKSSDGSNYNLLGIVKGAGNSQQKRSYDLYDARPYSGTTYYRLKQTDHDKASQYVGIVAAGTEERFEFSIFPNPVSKEEALNLTLQKHNLNAVLELELYDLTGKILFTTAANLSQPGLHLDIHQLGIEKGIYLVKVKHGSTNTVKKLIVK